MLRQDILKAKAGLWSLGAALALVQAGSARAESPAGTAIVNVARLTFSAGGGDGDVASNESRIVVAERLDVALTAGGVSTAADGTIVVAGVLTHLGNGREAFAISALPSQGVDRLVRLAVDSDGDGRYDPARDAESIAGRTPVLAPGQVVTVFAVLTAGTTGDVALTAAAATGSGASGTTFPGAGDGGGDAVTGRTGAAASIVVALGTPTPPVPTLTKTAAVVAPDGSTRAVQGATITYTLVARFPAATQAARLADAIPAGTAYAPASLSLDDAALSDAADTDAGDATPARIAVALGDQPAGATRTIRFKVVIQ